MEEKRINDDVELYLASDEPAEAENEPTAEEPTVEPASVKKNTPKAVRVGEVPEFRGRNKKRFKMSDGTEQEVFYASDVHVLDDETGQYDDIENTLTEDEDGKHLVCGRHSFVAKFSNDEKNDELFSIQRGKHKVTVLAKKNHNNKNKDGMSSVRKCDLDSENKIVRFSGIEEDSTYEYSVKNNGIKENIIVDKARRTYRYPFILKCENVKAVFDAYQKRIAFTDLATGDEIFHIPAPFMFDSKNVTSKAVSYKLEEEENGDSILTIIADSEWINDKERAFPVVIDPQINVTSASLLATYSWSSNNSMQRESEHLVGIVATSDSASATCKSRHRMYLDFNSPTLSLGARIKKAELKVYRKGDPAPSVNAPLGLYHVSDELCDYCYYEPGIDEDLIDYDDMNVIGSDICYSFDITNFIDRLNNGEAYNNKFAVKLVDETMSSNNNIVLYGATSAYAPELVIDYESNYAVNTSYQAHTHTIGKFGQAAIDLQYGNLTFDSTDFSWSGNRMPVTIKHFYNSVLYNKQYTKANISGLADFSAMNVGNGFRLNLMQCVCPVGDKYVYIDEYGVETILELDTNECTYKNKDGDISYNVCNSILSIGDEKLKFENDRLVEITSGKNTTKINYDSDRINSVVDSVGRVFKFKYYGANLTSIIAPDNTKIQYAYSGNYLSTIIYPDNTKAVIEYSSYKPTAVTIKNADNVSLYKIVYTFNGYKVASVTEYGASGNSFVQGAKSEFSYSMASKRTMVTTTEVDGSESNVIKTVYTFDDDGNVVSDYVYSEDTGNTGVDGTVSGIHPYVADGGANIIRNNTNLLSNHTFRNELCNWSASDERCCCTDIYTAALDDKLTKHALVIDSHDTEKTNNTVSQDTVCLSAGEYTFSAYVKVARKFCGENAGVFIRVSSADGEVLAISEKLDAYDSQYVRLIAPFTIDSAQSVKVEFVLNGDGCVHVCAPQLEDNPFANDYNMLENGNFERDTDSWYTSTNCSAVSDTRFNMSKSMRIIGDVKKQEFCYQMIEPICSRSVRETFTLSGWAKGYGLPMHDRNGSNVPSFRLRAVIHYSDGTTETHIADFSSCTDEWQFTSLQFSKGKFKAVSYIYIYCDYDYNFGTVFFDDIQLIRNNVETDLSVSDFVIESYEDTSDEDGSEVDSGNSENYDEDKDFKEALDEFANAITETTFTDGEFGTIYRSFGFTDNGNDLISETDARGNNTAYDVETNTSRNKEVTDRLDNKTAYEYDNSGRTTKITSKKADGTELAHVSYAYDAFDNMTEIVRGDGMKYALAYNEFHNLESIGVDGKAESLIKYTYKNGNGRLKQMTYANGHTMKTVYNSIGQMVAEKWFETEAAAASSTAPPIAHYKYVYDNSGNIVRSIDICAKKEYTYQYEEGRIVRAAEADIELSGEIVTAKVIVNTVRYHYDTEGKMTKKVITPASGSAQTVYYENPDDNTVVKFSAGGRTVTSHSKTDSFGRKVFDELQLGTDFVSRQFVYHAGKVTDTHKEKAKVKSSATTQLVSQIILSNGTTLSYGYDAEERITSVVETYTVDDTPVTNTTLYTYDALGQLLTETVNGEVVNSMEYDNYGNITKKNGKVYTYGNSKWKDLLTSYNGQSITYDAQGNPLTYLGHTLTWEKGRQLKSFDGNTYTYNANGIRTSKTVNGVKHTYTLDGTKILRETWGGNTLVPLYDNEDGVCGILYNSVPYYFIKNLQGDVIAIVDKDAQTVARYSYDAWGVPEIKIDSSACQIATINPYRYRGYYYDEEIGLYYLQSRYYDASIGRFICADVDEAVASSQRILDCNHFSYCENDPVNNIDENGGISFNKVMSIFNSIAKYAKKIMDWMKSYVDYNLKLYTSLSPSDISAIAKDIKRSPHRVRQALQSLNKKWSNIRTRIGKIARAITIVGLIVSVAYALSSGVAILDIVAEYIVEGLVELTKWLVSEGLKNLISLIPAVGALLGFFLGKLISIALDAILSTKFVKSIRDKFQNKVNAKTYKVWDYLVTYFKCWA